MPHALLELLDVLVSYWLGLTDDLSRSIHLLPHVLHVPRASLDELMFLLLGDLF
jgi:hypothetical protein